MALSIARRRLALDVTQTEETRSEALEEENPDIQPNTVVGQIRVPKKRGPTLGLSIFERKTKVHVDYDHLGNPTGPTKKIVNELTTFIGVMARTAAFCPIEKPTWADVPLEGKERAWDEIKLRFATNEMEVKECVFEKMSACWRGFKSDLKVEYYVPEDRQASINNLDDKRVDKEQWVPLVDFWDSAEAQEESARNRENSKSGKIRHCLGRTSHSVVIQNLIEKGVRSPDRADVFIVSHTRKDGTIHPSAADCVEEIQKAKEANETSSESIVTETGYGDLLMQVLGPPKHGRLNCAGFRATVTNTWGPRKKRITSSCETNSMRQELEFLKAQLAEVPTLKDQLQTVVGELRETKQRNGELEERTTKMLELFTSIQSGFNCWNP